MAEQRQGGNFWNREFAGVPGWIWAAGGVVVVAGFLYLRHQAKSSQGAGQQQATQQGQPSAQLSLIPFQTITKTWHVQHHKSPHKSKTKNTGGGDG